MRLSMNKSIVGCLFIYFLLHIALPASAVADENCMEIADIPLVTQIESAPPLVMILLDDSSSMNWDILCPESHGKFDGQHKVSKVTTKWKSQWAGYNRIYYSPDIDYEPWATMSDADKDYPLTEPNGTTTQNLDSQFDSIDSVSIPYAHFYSWSDSENEPYLITLSGTARYYRVTPDSVTDVHATVSDLSYVSSPPSDIVVDYNEHRQNFANWYSYYRTRELVAKASLGKVISSVSEIKLGLHSINGSVTETVQPIKISGEEDKSGYILEKLYASDTGHSTPLRLGLEDVGQYFDADDNDTGNIGASPFASESDGGTCQQAFVIVMTDGYYNGSTPSVGNADGDNSSTFDGAPYGDTYSNSLADVAMKYYEEDLSSSLADSVPTNAADSATHQHMVTYTISFGLTGTLTYDENCPGDTTACPTWTDPTGGNDEKIDQLWHAAVNGRGDFLTANDTTELTTALDILLTDIQNRSRTGASVTLSTQKIESTTAIYQTFFDSSTWAGDVQAWSLADTSVMNWSAKTQLNSVNATDRKILTFNGSTGVPFRHATLSGTQQLSITADEVDYLRGNSSKEVDTGNGSFRNRDGKLGDIVNSSPVLFNDMIYVGANDGMLHCFDAATGNEMFAYVPGLVYGNLKNYTDQDYTHNYFVDNTPYTATTGSTSLLIGSLGKGGKGVFGIDISTVSAISETAIPDIWEYPSAVGDDDMGYSFSSVSMLESNSGTLTTPLIVMGNGYNSNNGHAVLYLLNPDGTLFQKIDTESGGTTPELCNGLSSPAPVDIDFDGKVDYVYAGDLLGNLWKFDLTDQTPSNWDVAYNDGSSKMPLFQAKSPDGTVQPITGKPDVMFHCDGSKKGCVVIFGTGSYLSLEDSTSTDIQSIYGIWDWDEEWMEAGTTSPEKYAMGYFAPFDNDTRPLSNIDGNPLFPSDLKLTLLQQLQVSLDDDYRDTTSFDISWFSPTAWKNTGPDDTYSAGSHLGWYFDLPTTGERVIADVQINDGRAIVVSITPSQSICSAGGSSIVHVLDACSGAQLDDPQFDTDDDGDVDDDDDNSSGKVLDNIYYAPVIIEDQMVFDKDVIVETEAEKTGMFYWKLID